ncbi:MAG TPA: hypothetical protein PLF35_14415, partial [Prolixibacteraceae bacterium]|nr:hypothetical protein [Prolixibacteraceae bacterium]
YTPTQTTPLTSTVVFTVSDGYGTSETRLNIGRVGKVVDGNISFSPSEPCFNQPITATISDENFSGTPQYQWYINNELIEGATNESYIPLHSQIGQELSVRISSSSNMEKGIIEESAGIVNRGINPNIPTAPTIAYYTHNSLKIEEDNSQAYEYAVLVEYDQSSPQWQTSNIFNNLLAGVNYSCYRRIQSGTIYQASESSPETLVTLRTTPYSAIELTFKDYLTKDVLPNVYIEAYGNDGEWIGSTNGTATFVLPTSMQYRIYAEASGYVNHETSEVFIVKTGINRKTIFMYPTGDLAGTVYITCDGTPRYGITLKTEFSAINNNQNTLLYQWQRNGVDVVGETNPTYEVDTVTDIDAVISIEVSSADRNGTINATLSPNPIKDTRPAPAAPVVIGKSDTHITVEAEDGCEYMAFVTSAGNTGSVWQASNQFAGLNPETEYTIYKRYAENDIYFASNYSSITEITTTTSSTTYE